MSAQETGADAALEPARDELLRAARADAEALLARAREEADRTLRAAREEAEAVTDLARRQGAEDGKADFAARVGQARREAAAARLAAMGGIHADFARLVTVRVGELYAADPSARARLAARAGALLGPEARTSEHPAGGVRAVAPGREVDLGVPALAARALDAFGAGVERLWRP
ncbi:hypothetical protein [Streptomyces sp. HPF1205]|uniref:hypothetical protein n=1 Tax=Streptomyces sp. HPF1205 TaxID=2873262 RepID=UPI001CECEC94|nr:hypothetical protein [Streptomyces sp. HPF1205]